MDNQQSRTQQTRKPSKRRRKKAPNTSLLEVLVVASFAVLAVVIGLRFYVSGEKPIEPQPTGALAQESATSSITTNETEKPTATPTPKPTPSPTPTPEPTELETEEPEGEAEQEEITPLDVPLRKVGMLDLPSDIISPYTGNYGSPLDGNGSFLKTSTNWYLNKNKNHQPPTAQKDFDIRELNGHYLGDISQKVVYLTFDEGYENGYTEKILDVLLEKNVQAAFFVTKPYIKSNQGLVKRMVSEGHLVGNHSVTHKEFPTLSDEEIVAELNETAEYFKEVTQMEMPKIVRPPGGVYSAHSLAVSDSLGYKTFFWSFAYKDWLVDDQPGKEVAYNTVMDNLHNGSIILLHAVSQSNTEALPNIIDSIREQGYTFESLEEIGS